MRGQVTACPGMHGLQRLLWRVRWLPGCSQKVHNVQRSCMSPSEQVTSSGVLKAAVMFIGR